MNYEEAHGMWEDAACERGPLCPLDLPDEVWAAVAANYETDWSPGPNYHAEYRDARVAAFAMMEYLTDNPRAN